MTRDELFGATVQKAHEWVHEVARELGTEDRRRAYLALRATLHALRDRMPVEEAAQLAAQLPLLVRGAFYEGYTPARTPRKERHLDEFLAHVAAGMPGETDLEEAKRCAVAVMAVLDRHVTQGELEDVKAVLHESIRAIWPAGARAS